MRGLECWRMQLWFAHESAVTLREQLVTQIILGILSDDLRPGQRLPSIRDLARRFRFHRNTVSAGYRQLNREHWVKFRRGSGVYVRDTNRKERSRLSSRSISFWVSCFVRRAGWDFLWLRFGSGFGWFEHPASRSFPIDRA